MAHYREKVQNFWVKSLRFDFKVIESGSPNPGWPNADALLVSEMYWKEKQSVVVLTSAHANEAISEVPLTTCTTTHFRSHLKARPREN